MQAIFPFYYCLLSASSHTLKKGLMSRGTNSRRQAGEGERQHKTKLSWLVLEETPGFQALIWTLDQCPVSA